MKLLIMGPPGVGKGTQASLLKDELKIIHLSTGDILRSETKNQSTVGLKAKSYMNAGKLVPDEVLLDIINDRITKKDCLNGYLLDGFPRTLNQAIGLDKIMVLINQKIDYAISLVADENELVDRLIKRGVDSGRSDDTPEIIRNRQKIYWEKTAPLLNFYRGKNILKEVNGLGEISEITKRILIKIK